MPGRTACQTSNECMEDPECPEFDVCVGMRKDREKWEEE